MAAVRFVSTNAIVLCVVLWCLVSGADFLTTIIMAAAAADAEKDTKKRAADGEAEGDSKDEKKAKKPKAEKKAKKADTLQINVNKAVDKAHEGKSFTEIVKLPPSALQGLSEAADEIFASTYHHLIITSPHLIAFDSDSIHPSISIPSPIRIQH